MRLCFVKAGPSGPTVGSPATVAKVKPPCGGQWCVAVVQAAHGAQRINNTHTVEQWEFSALCLIIDCQARPTVCTPPHRDRGWQPLSNSGGDNNGLMGINSGVGNMMIGVVWRSCAWCSLHNNNNTNKSNRLWHNTRETVVGRSCA